MSDTMIIRTLHISYFIFTTIYEVNTIIIFIFCMRKTDSKVKKLAHGHRGRQRERLRLRSV